MMSLYDYYKEQAKAPLLDKMYHQIEEEYNHITNNVMLKTAPGLDPVTLPKLQKVIKRQKNKKSSGYDEISNYMIKILQPAYVQCFVKCFNVWFQKMSLSRLLEDNQNCNIK